jgi:hypothetical protein
MNILTFREPSLIYQSDSSEFSFGGYNILSGTIWCFELPIPFHLRTTLNALEFMLYLQPWDGYRNQTFPIRRTKKHNYPQLDT